VHGDDVIVIYHVIFLGLVRLKDEKRRGSIKEPGVNFN
jgi:hypothetical protein